jgi:hypothetical protein
MSLGQIVRAVVRPGCLDAPWRLPYGEGLRSGLLNERVCAAEAASGSPCAGVGMR